MSFAQLLTETATVVRFTTDRDEYNAEVDGTATRTDHRARLEQLTTEEIIRDRDTVVADWRMFLLPGVDVTPYDHVEARGFTFDVVGLPDELRTPRGAHHLEVLLKVRR